MKRALLVAAAASAIGVAWLVRALASVYPGAPPAPRVPWWEE